LDKKTGNTRIFTFGVGDDVNAAMLDKLADETRAVSTYVRPAEDIEVKVSGLYGKISHPVLTDLKLKVTGGATLSETYPTQLPDLFHGGQLVVLSKYTGRGSVAVTLTGRVGSEKKELVYEFDLPKKTDDDKAFVEGLWARRKIGYLLDQIRGNGENKELVEEVVKLAKKHGITTPYTSYLLVPDATPRTPLVQSVPTPLAPLPTPYLNGGYPPPTSVMPMSAPTSAPLAPVSTTMSPAYTPAPMASNGYDHRPSTSSNVNNHSMAPSSGMGFFMPHAKPADCCSSCGGPTFASDPFAQSGKEGVDLAMQLRALKSDERASTKSRQVGGKSFAEVNGVWTDLGLKSEAKTVKVKVMSDAYFALLKKHPELKEVFQLGQRIVWVTPSGTVLVVGDDGSDKMTDDEIESLFKK
jgi:Ca-activated chloride channel family protein